MSDESLCVKDLRLSERQGRGGLLFRANGLTRAQFNILVLVREAGEQGRDGLIQAEIGREMLVTAASISGHMDRLERAGLIVRTPMDRRTNRVNLTERARELLDRIDSLCFAVPLFFLLTHRWFT